MGATFTEVHSGNFEPHNHVINHAWNGCAIGINCPAPSNGTGWYVDARSNKFVGTPSEITGTKKFTGTPLLTRVYNDTAPVTLWNYNPETGLPTTSYTKSFDELMTTRHNTATQDLTNGFVSGNLSGLYPLSIEGVPASFANDPLRGFNVCGFRPNCIPGFTASKYKSNLGGTLAPAESPYGGDIVLPTFSNADVETVYHNTQVPSSYIKTSTANTTLANRKVSWQGLGTNYYCTIDFDMVVTDRPSTQQSTESNIPVEYWYRQLSTTVTINLYDIIKHVQDTIMGMSQVPYHYSVQALAFRTEHGAPYSPITTTQVLAASYKTNPTDHVYFKSGAVVPDWQTVPKNDSVIMGARAYGVHEYSWCTGLVDTSSTSAPSWRAVGDSGTIDLVIPSMKGVWLQYHSDNPTRKVIRVSLTISMRRPRVPSVHLHYWHGLSTDGGGYMTTNSNTFRRYADPILMRRELAGDIAKAGIYPGLEMTYCGVGAPSLMYYLIDHSLSGVSLTGTNAQYVKKAYSSPNCINVDPNTLFTISPECAISCGFLQNDADIDIAPTMYYRPTLENGAHQYRFDKRIVNLIKTSNLYKYSIANTQDSTGAVLCPYNNNVFVTGEFRYNHFRMGINMAYFGSWSLTGDTIGTSASLMRQAWDTLDTVNDVSDALTYTMLNYRQVSSSNTYGNIGWANVQQYTSGSTSEQLRGSVDWAPMLIPNQSDMWQKYSSASYNTPVKSTLYPYVFGMRSGQYEQPDRNGNYHCVLQGDIWTANPRGGLYAVSD